MTQAARVLDAGYREPDEIVQVNAHSMWLKGEMQADPCAWFRMPLPNGRTDEVPPDAIAWWVLGGTGGT